MTAEITGVFILTEVLDFLFDHTFNSETSTSASIEFSETIEIHDFYRESRTEDVDNTLVVLWMRHAPCVAVERARNGAARVFAACAFRPQHKTYVFAAASSSLRLEASSTGCFSSAQKNGWTRGFSLIQNRIWCSGEAVYLRVRQLTLLRLASGPRLQF